MWPWWPANKPSGKKLNWAKNNLFNAWTLQEICIMVKISCKNSAEDCIQNRPLPWQTQMRLCWPYARQRSWRQRTNRGNWLIFTTSRLSECSVSLMLGHWQDLQTEFPCPLVRKQETKILQENRWTSARTSQKKTKTMHMLHPCSAVFFCTEAAGSPYW